MFEFIDMFFIAFILVMGFGVSVGIIRESMRDKRKK